MKKSIYLIIITILLLSLSACSKEENISVDEKNSIKIGYLPITHALPLFIEEDGANLKSAKLELIKFGSWAELIEALNAGQIDGASMLVELAMKSKEQGIGLKSVALGHRDGNVVVVSKEINKASDLKGKTVSIPSKLSSHNILLYQMLKENNLKQSDINVVELPPAEMPAALSEGRISACIVAEPFGAISITHGAAKFYTTHKNYGKTLYAVL